MLRVLAATLVVLGSSTTIHAEGVLGGAAALTSAIMPAVTGAIRAGADKQVNAINTAATVYMNDAALANKLLLAGIQSQTTMYQTWATSVANQLNQAAVTTRLGMQLATLERLSTATMGLKQMQFMAEFGLKMHSLALQERAIGAQAQQAQAQQALEIAKAGLSVGGSATNSGAELTPTETGLVTGTAATSSDATRALSQIASRPPTKALAIGDGVILRAPQRTPAGVFAGSRRIRTIDAYGDGSTNRDALAVPFQSTN